MKRTYLLFFFILIYHTSYPQNNYKVILQNQFNGGVCFAGILTSNTNENPVSYNIPINIEPNSFIKNAYLVYSIASKYDTLKQINIVINNTSINLVDNSISNSFRFSPNQGLGWITQSLNIIDCRNYISNSNQSISIEIPGQLPLTIGATFNNFYFYIEYENPSLPLINTCLMFNEEDIWVPMEYNLNQHNKMDTTKDISISLLTDNICGDWDAYKIMVNQDSIGLIYGKDNINQSFCQGVGGHFYHQNETTFGLDDDSPDFNMDSSDALANIRPYITDPNSFGLDFIFHPGINPGGVQTDDFPDGLTNSINAFVLAYTPACNATNIDVAFTDTTICKGSTINLQASGGVSYKWSPSTFLSDSTIANPVCSATEPIWYTCTITNADTCSKTLPVFVNVKDSPTLNYATIPDTCGYNTGGIVAFAEGEEPFLYSLNNGTPQNTPLFTPLSFGYYNLSVRANNGCTATKNVYVNPIIITQANYTATPSIANPPAEVELINQSEYYTNSIWYISEANTYITLDSFYTQNSNYTFQDTGVYNVMLITYNQTPSCADTTYGVVQIVPPFSINIPNVFTPNQDQINDVFTIDIEGAQSLSCKIFNRWGNLVYAYETETSYLQQTLPIWEALTADNFKVSDGTYFYVVTVETAIGEKKSYSGTVQVFGE